MKKFVIVVLFVVSLLFVTGALAGEPKLAAAKKVSAPVLAPDKIDGDFIAPPFVSNMKGAIAAGIIAIGDKLLGRPETVPAPDTRHVPKEILDASPPTLADKLPNVPGQATISADPVAEAKAVEKAKSDKSKADKSKAAKSKADKSRKAKTHHRSEKLDHPDKPQKDVWDNSNDPGTFTNERGDKSMMS